jgi:hypothetical protein
MVGMDTTEDAIGSAGEVGAGEGSMCCGSGAKGLT